MGLGLVGVGTTSQAPIESNLTTIAEIIGNVRCDSVGKNNNEVITYFNFSTLSGKTVLLWYASFIDVTHLPLSLTKWQIGSV
jgi:hypothetical protein